jgi:S1-C subfamily serine protease
VNWVDGVLVVIFAVSAVRGFRAGAALQTLVFAGIWLGLLAGVLLVPPLAGLAWGSARAVIALVVIFTGALVFGGAGVLIGRRLHDSLQRLHLGIADSVVGVAIGLVSSVLLVWVLGSVLSASRYTTLNRTLHGSAVLRTVDRVMPPLPQIFARVESFLADQGYPLLFLNLPPGLVAPAEVPADVAIREAFRAAQNSTVKIQGRACDAIESGSGFVAAPDLVVTNAHVVAGEARTEVIDRSGTHQATVVVYDTNLDVAVLRVSALDDPALPIRREPVARDTTAAIMGYPEGGPLEGAPAAVTARFNATGLNIYGTAATVREVYELNGTVQPGNSGGPLVASGQDSGTGGIKPGTVIGVIFARSATDAQVGYALTMDGVAVDLARAATTAKRVSTGACLPAAVGLAGADR